MNINFYIGIIWYHTPDRGFKTVAVFVAVAVAVAVQFSSRKVELSRF